jgi:hypothetical protein
MLNIVDAGGDLIDSLRATIDESIRLTDKMITDKTWADWHAQPLPEIGKFAEVYKGLNKAPMVRIHK